LANARRAWRELVQRAEREEWSYRDFLALLVSEEIAQRQQTRIARMVRRAHFPFFKTIDDFNFSMQSSVRLALLGSTLAPDFVTEGRCVIFGGKPGRGKTHLAVAVAYRAIQNGFDALFVTAAELIDDLSAAFRGGRLADALDRYLHPAVLVCDEVGYLTYGTDAANVLFHVVNDRHRKKRAMIFTTNKPLTGWGRVLHDEDLAHAIVDRILERGRMLTLDGPSMRTHHLGLDDPTATPPSIQTASVSGEGARISGIQRPEFPEPTTAVRRPVSRRGQPDAGRTGANVARKPAPAHGLVGERLHRNVRAGPRSSADASDRHTRGRRVGRATLRHVAHVLAVRCGILRSRRSLTFPSPKSDHLESTLRLGARIQFPAPCRRNSCLLIPR
jgi:DNA replication protein DnaC